MSLQPQQCRLRELVHNVLLTKVTTCVVCSASQSPKTPVAAPQPSEPARKFLMPQHSHLQGEALSPKDATYEVPRASKNEQRFLSPHPRERTAVSCQGSPSDILPHCPTSAWAVCNIYMACVSMTYCLQ